MPRGLVGGEHRAAEAHLIAVVQHPIDLGGGVAAVGIEKILRPAALYHRHVAVHDHVFSTGLPDQLGAAGDMIPMGMADQQDPDVLESKPERFNAGADQGHRGFQAGVDQDMAPRRHDQIRGQIAAADVVQIVRDPKRRDRGGPIRLRCGRQPGGRQQQRQADPRRPAAARVAQDRVHGQIIARRISSGRGPGICARTSTANKSGR